MMNSMNMWQSVQVYKLPKLLIASLFALLVALLSFIGSAAVSAETQVSVTPYENLSTTSTTVVMVSVSGLTPNTDVAIRQVAINYVQEPGFTGNRIEQLHKAVVTTDGSGAFSVQIPVRYDVRTDQTFSDYCQNDTALRRLCYLHVQYQSDESTDVIAQPKLYFGVSGPVVDTTAPTVTIVTPADKAVYQQNEVVPVQYACVDVPNATSVVTCDGDLLNDSLLDTSTPGTYTFTVNSADGAGNDASVTHTYTVAPVIVLPIMPTSKDECFKNGWKAFGSMFANQGQCVSSVSGNNRSAR